MRATRLFRWTLWLQTIYYFVTALWPLVDIDSFMFVTGPKTDVWLVKSVGMLLVPITLCFLLHLFMEVNHWPVAILAAGCCIGFIAIDVYYVLNDVISPIYLADAVAEFILLIGWVIIVVKALSGAEGRANVKIRQP